MKIMGPNFPEGKCDIVSCTECGFVFNAYESATQKDFNDYYISNNSKTVNYYDMLSADLADTYFEHLYNGIKKYINKESQILDVAGGYGEFSKYLLDKGYLNVSLLEMKTECIQYAKNIGINVIEGNLLEIEDIKHKYDLVICSHDLEHFIDIDKAIDKMRDMVKSSGYIFIEVPDIEEYEKLDRAPYHFLTYEHVCHFSENTLYNIANKFGFSIEYLERYVKCNDYPCLYGVFTVGNKEKGMTKDEISMDAMKRYVVQCENEIAQATKVFEENQDPLIIWGIGASTAQLLNGNFDRCNVIQLVDSNKSRQGIGFNISGRNLKVSDPMDITDREATIFILPTAYKESIMKSIRSYGLDNNVVSLK